MKTISTWASHHLFAARLLLVLLHTYLLFSAFVFYDWLADHHVQIGLQWFAIPIIMGLLVLVALTLFKRKLLALTNRFALGKTKFLIIAVCSFIFIVGTLHTGSVTTFCMYNHVQGSFVDTTIKKQRPIYDEYADKKKFEKDLKDYYASLSKRELKRELRKELRNEGSTKDSSDAMSALYVLLILVGTILALFGVAALACSIACAGSGGLAILLLFLGTFGAIYLAIYLIKKVFKKKKPMAKDGK